MKKARVPNIICIEALVVTLLVATPLAAQSGGVPRGCFARVYSEAHLAAQPQQVVAALWLEFLRDPNSDDAPGFRIGARMADQGHARRDGLGGRVLGEAGYCTGPDYCEVLCHGGSFAVTLDTGTMIEITTDHLRVADGPGCGAAPATVTTLAEIPGQPTTYRLLRADDAACGGA